MDTTGEKYNLGGFSTEINDSNIGKSSFMYQYLFPLILSMFAIFSLINFYTTKANFASNDSYFERNGNENPNESKYNILSLEDLSSGIKDTVYTDKECWLELVIHKQVLYQHWRDGRTEKYLVSTGNKFADAEALESRPGLFAIFIKEEHHQSTQFNSANMYHFMPFNQGIGFHSIDGKAYYSNLGVRPSSHGCIRMRHEDAKKLYKECPLGTLVLATRGYSARTVGFAPPGFRNEIEYTKDDYKKMLALNLFNIISGRYYIEKRERFIVDPKMIPVSGVYISYDVKTPEHQIVPRSYLSFFENKDKVYVAGLTEILLSEHSEELVRLISFTEGHKSELLDKNYTDDSYAQLIKSYFHNPIGILPYFGPKK